VTAATDRPAWTGRPLWHVTLPWRRPPLMANDTGTLRNSMVARAACRDDMARVARSLRIPPATGPVVAVLTWYHATNKVVDSDNVAPTLKRILDGLRIAGVLQDDSGRHVMLTAQRCIPRDLDPFPGAGPRLVLSLYDAQHLDLPHLEPSPSATFTTHVAPT
jgi:hypothetical protein